MKDVILNYHKAEQLLQNINCLKYGSLVSIGDPGTSPPEGYNSYKKPKIRLCFRDSNKGKDLCSEQQISQLISFLSKNGDNPTIFHCHMGIGRSAASCLIKMAILQKERSLRDAQNALNFLLRVKSCVYPNSRMIEMADDILGYNGFLSKIRSTYFDDTTKLIV